MCRLRSAAALMILLVAAPSQSAVSGAALCVTPVPITRTSAKSIAAKSEGPTAFLLGDEATTPLAIDRIEEPLGPNRVRKNMVLWSFAKDGHFRGPFDIVDAEPQGANDRWIYLEVFDREPSENAEVAQGDAQQVAANRRKLLVVQDGGAPKPLALPPRAPGRLAGFVAPAANGFGPIVFSKRPDPELPKRQLQENWLVAGSTLAPTQRQGAARFAFPQAKLIVASNRQEQRITDVRTGSSITVATPPTEEFSGIESVTLDRFGWLFVENGGADYAIKLARGRAGLMVDHITQFSGRGWFGRLISWLLGFNKGVRVDETHWSPQCVDQSKVLQLTLFCRPFKVFRNGEREELETVHDDTTRWLADATGSGVALLLQGRFGTTQTLYATDGSTVQMLVRGERGPISVQDIPQAGRTFVSLRYGYHEVVGRFPNLRLRRISFFREDGHSAWAACCLHQYQGGDVRFMPIEQSKDVLAFHSSLGIWRIGRTHATMLWPTGAFAIDLPNVAQAKVWGGDVFLTVAHEPFVVRSCSKPRTAD